jgi:hypothetical protein
VSIVRVPFLSGVVSTVDPTYTVAPTSIIGFASSPVAHICAAVPTSKALFRFFANGFKLDTKPSSSNAYSSTGKSYKSLKDSKNVSAHSGRTLGGDLQGSKGSSSNSKDPYRMSSFVDPVDAVDDGDTVELRTVETHSNSALVRTPSYGKTEFEKSHLHGGHD